MPDLNLQQKEVVDVLRSFSFALSGEALAYQLRWASARLYPILAQLIEKKVIKVQVGKEYPHVRAYSLVNSDRGSDQGTSQAGKSGPGGQASGR